MSNRENMRHDIFKDLVSREDYFVGGFISTGAIQIYDLFDNITVMVH